MTGEILASERPRLVRLCARLTGDFQQAEDLAQETLSRAWHYRERRDPRRPVKPYLDAIARNVCRTYLARRRESLPLGSDEALNVLEDPLTRLERADLLNLLHEALDALPEPTRAALVARYLEETPVGEIARRLETTDDAVNVRLHRGRLALKRLLERGETPPGAFPGTPTDLWCSRCGQKKLHGGIYTTPDGTRHLELRCADCFKVAQSRYIRGHGEEYLGGLSALRPTLKRTMRVAHAFWRAALSQGSGRCLHCGRPVPLRIGRAPGTEQLATATAGTQAARPALILRCACGACRWQWADDLVISLPEVQRLQSRHTRVRQVFPTPNRVRIEALNSSAFVEIRTDPCTFQPREVQTQGIAKE
jgi:RNA polymerase sigma factor (sigma-70 family)